jgi:transcriptional regulator with XRE-family HTH domain
MASGPQIRALREALNITGKELAGELHCHVMTIRVREGKAHLSDRIIREHIEALKSINAKREAAAERMVDEL